MKRGGQLRPGEDIWVDDHLEDEYKRGEEHISALHMKGKLLKAGSSPAVRRTDQIDEQFYVVKSTRFNKKVSMAFRQPALVSRQFNSPIKLYSQENVAETLNKQAQILANGALGIIDPIAQVWVTRANQEDGSCVSILQSVDCARGVANFRRLTGLVHDKYVDFLVSVAKTYWILGTTMCITITPSGLILDFEGLQHEEYTNCFIVTRMDVTTVSGNLSLIMTFKPPYPFEDPLLENLELR
uniref:Zasp-like motif domain-containing protein n=1 Tax=Timema genevievae TaxID=629358 RepID=A0A7R9PLP5_TIMGE|nr:unnamed protein product [Timema genevievae]